MPAKDDDLIARADRLLEHRLPDPVMESKEAYSRFEAAKICRDTLADRRAGVMQDDDPAVKAARAFLATLTT